MHTVLFFCLPLTVLTQSDVIMLSKIFSPYFVESIIRHTGGWKLKINGHFNKVIIYLITIGLVNETGILQFIPFQKLFLRNSFNSDFCIQLFRNKNGFFSTILWGNVPHKNPQRSVMCLERRHTWADRYDLLPCVLLMQSVHKQNGKRRDADQEKRKWNTSEANINWEKYNLINFTNSICSCSLQFTLITDPWTTN